MIRLRSTICPRYQTYNIRFPQRLPTFLVAGRPSKRWLSATAAAECTQLPLSACSPRSSRRPLEEFELVGLSDTSAGACAVDELVSGLEEERSAGNRYARPRLGQIRGRTPTENILNWLSYPPFRGRKTEKTADEFRYSSKLDPSRRPPINCATRAPRPGVVSSVAGLATLEVGQMTRRIPDRTSTPQLIRTNRSAYMMLAEQTAILNIGTFGCMLHPGANIRMDRTQ